MLLGTALLVVLLTPGVFRSSQPEKPSSAGGTWGGLRTHPRALCAAIVLAGVAPLFGFTAIALGLVGYLTTPPAKALILTHILQTEVKGKMSALKKGLQQEPAFPDGSPASRTIMGPCQIATQACDFRPRSEPMVR